ncbi:hypothetical protein L2E82_05834 [Cichorium intybus]|uniref:Uncharacterized protein n=1 Tax=Cichorium intybus TaxID=13427 RepID=A0ACB9HAJ6_CICIN|nr:hypothetical protein L2E82_05834 [Cichorium intybus]
MISKLVIHRKQSFSSEFTATCSFSGKPTVNNVLKLGELVILGIAIDGCALAFVLRALITIYSSIPTVKRRASTEVLGKGTFGTTYKAALEDASTLVVKRLKEVAAAKRDFEVQMEVVGNIRHENVGNIHIYSGRPI